MAKHFYAQSVEQIGAWMQAQSQPAYRAKQVMAAVYRRAIASFDQVTELPDALREALAADFDLHPLDPVAVSRNGDTTKLLLAFPAGGQAESVRIDMDGAFTACVSSQIGCAVNCAFCATGYTPYERSLTAGEILSQVVAVNRLGDPVRNVVFMGMGEPFHNYANVVTVVRRLTDKAYFGMSPRRVTMSTAGVVPGIHKYAEEGLATELAVSLNASTDVQRGTLMPGVARWPLAQLLEACRHFSTAHGGRPVTFAYVLLDEVNDSFDDAERLGKLLTGQPHHLNVIPWNEVDHLEFKAPAYPRVRAFLHACKRYGLNVSLRHSKGGDIEAACGQLRAQHAECPPESEAKPKGRSRKA